MEYVQVTPIKYPVNLIDKDWSQPILYGPSQAFADTIHGMEILEDDVWLVTYPKCGTTWMQELLWLLLNDCNFEAALAKDLELRSVYLEWDKEENLKRVEELPSPRLIKSHLPLALLPAQLWQRKTKVVYVFRNPKDAWVSLYYRIDWIGKPKTLAEFIDELMAENSARNQPIEHATEFYQLRNESWLFYTSFERMKHDLRSVINDVCGFLNKTVTDEQMERLLKHLSFEEMKKNQTTNHLWEIAREPIPINNGAEKPRFMRSGKVNGYKEELTPDTIEKADCFLNERLQRNNVTLEELLLLNEP